jgi:hypothetical protein
MIVSLLKARATLSWRRSSRAGLALRALGLAFGAAVCGIFCLAVWSAGAALEEKPQVLAANGGPLAIFAAWLAVALVARVWMALLPAAQGDDLFDLRRFRVYPVRPLLLSAVNFTALFCEPSWLFLYPLLAVIGLRLGRLPGAAGAGPFLLAEALAVLSTGGLLFLVAALLSALDARPLLRRGLSAALLLAGFAVFEHSSVDASAQRRLTALFQAGRAPLLRFTPPGWAAQLARSCAEGQTGRAAGMALLLLVFGAGCAALAHALASREGLRPPEQVEASASAARGSGWSLPFLGGPLSALLEKEAKTALRAGWLQLVLVPVAYLLFVRTVFAGPEPLLIAAGYAHLAVLDVATNAFGRDTSAARGYFLWPLSLREVLAAKNAVAYAFSLAIYALLAGAAAATGGVRASSIALGLCAHLATFPLLAAMGNAISVLAPVPVRGGRLRRVRGAGTVTARLGAMAVLAGAAWAPYALAQATGLRVYAAYLGELVAMAVVYLGSLGAAAKLLADRRETVLAALAKDD